MKLRIRGNTLRLRLLQTEVATLREKGRISESIAFGPSDDDRLTYTLAISETAKEPHAAFEKNEIVVSLPSAEANTWVSTEQVGISANTSSAGSTLDLLIEKDFVCLTRTDDPDNADAYPNPEMEC